MAATLRSFFGYDTQTEILPTTQRSLPASWYRDPVLYELERRAVFSKAWMLITHRIRFTNPGDYIQFTEAGFNFVLCLDRESNLVGFHNICRHRGFPVLQSQSGNAKIFACKYHGWSYSLQGKLAKAPHFDKFSDFQKENNSLLPIHVHIDKKGFVWVNLDASPEPTPWSTLFKGVDERPVLDFFDPSNYMFDHTWEAQGQYNWKTNGDNYNECLHCKTCHPDTDGIVEISAYRVEGHQGSLQHYNRRQEDGLNGGFKIASTYFYPNANSTVAPDFFYLMRCVPTSVNTCTMEAEVYRSTTATDADFSFINDMFKRVLSEDKYLCNQTQKNLDSGVYVAGQLHPDYESGPLYLQELVRKAVYAHREEERKVGRKVWPASQKVVGTGVEGAQKDEAFCSSLACETSEDIAW